MGSLLARLFRYQPTEGRSPREDFFTEVLAGVLHTSPDLRAGFAGWMAGRKLENAYFTTQKVTPDGNRLDVWIEGEDDAGERHLIVVEHKLGAPAGPDQLERYERYLGQFPSAASRTLVYVTMQRPAPFLTSVAGVTFQSRRWFEVADWLRQWQSGREGRATTLVREVLHLMEEWGMEMGLNAHELSAAVTYHMRARHRLVQVLNENWQVCGVEGSQSNRWTYDTERLVYQSPYIGRERSYLEFGFDFDRQDDDWDVPRLQLPSAYFGIRGDDVSKRVQRKLSNDWKEPPATWQWQHGSRVKQLGALTTSGPSLHDAYLEFFRSSLREAEEAAKDGRRQ